MASTSRRPSGSGWATRCSWLLRGRDRGAAGDHPGPDRRALCRALAIDKLISGITLTTISLPEFVAAYFVIFLLTQLHPDLPARRHGLSRHAASGPSCTPSPCR
jgi:hypothetical protein